MKGMEFVPKTVKEIPNLKIACGIGIFFNPEMFDCDVSCRKDFFVLYATGQVGIFSISQ